MNELTSFMVKQKKLTKTINPGLSKPSLLLLHYIVFVSWATPICPSLRTQAQPIQHGSLRQAA